MKSLQLRKTYLEKTSNCCKLTSFITVEEGMTACYPINLTFVSPSSWRQAWSISVMAFLVSVLPDCLIILQDASLLNNCKQSTETFKNVELIFFFSNFSFKLHQYLYLLIFIIQKLFHFSGLKHYHQATQMIHHRDSWEF